MEIPESAQAKLDRARHHINDLNVSIGEYLQQSPFKLCLSFDPRTGDLTLSVKTNIPIPPHIPNIIGDAVHCIRCALDHVYWGIMEMLVTRKQDIQFPIYTTESKVSVMGRRHISKAPKNVAKEIELSEPHPGGKYGIYELNALDVQDKHQLLIVAGRATKIKANLVSILLPEIAGRISGDGVIQFVGQSEEMFRVPLPFNHPTARRGPFEDEIDVAVPYGIVFGDGPFAGSDVVSKLMELTDLIEARSIAIWAAR